jgi:hypothetical protein
VVEVINGKTDFVERGLEQTVKHLIWFLNSTEVILTHIYRDRDDQINRAGFGRWAFLGLALPAFTQFR